MYNINIEEIMNKLGSCKDGLTSTESNKRLNENGKNELPKKKKDSVLKIFFNEFKDPIILLLLFAILASFMVGEIIDAFAILFIILVDIIMGTYQENKANNTAEALESLVTVKTKVIRNGNVAIIDSKELTIGDIVILESGDKIAADLRVIESHNLTNQMIQVKSSIFFPLSRSQTATNFS